MTAVPYSHLCPLAAHMRNVPCITPGTLSPSMRTIMLDDKLISFPDALFMFPILAFQYSSVVMFTLEELCSSELVISRTPRTPRTLNTDSQSLVNN